jgi:hypothetical protein
VKYAKEYDEEKAETITIKLWKDEKYNLDEIANTADLSISRVHFYFLTYPFFVITAYVQST